MVITYVTSTSSSGNSNYYLVSSNYGVYPGNAGGNGAKKDGRVIRCISSS